MHADASLGELHEVIVEAMGWDGGHLHMFSDDITQYGTPDGDLGFADEGEFALADVLFEPGDRLRYIYDFGDDWDHDISTAPSNQPAHEPVQLWRAACLALISRVMRGRVRRTSPDALLDKPDDMFDRDVEWMELTAFTADERPGATLGIVSGTRRQGKTFPHRICHTGRAAGSGGPGAHLARSVAHRLR